MTRHWPSTRSIAWTSDAVGGIGAGAGAGGLEREVARGLALLQSARVLEAIGVLRRQCEAAEGLAPSGYARSALALALAASGEHDEVIELERQVAIDEHVTYLDAASASIAGGAGACP